MAVYGRAGTGKSWLAIELAFALAAGEPWLGLYPTEKCKVLVIQTEQTERQYQRRIVKYCDNLDGVMPDNISFDNDMELKLDQFHGLNAIIQDIEEQQPDVVILDCLYQMISGSVSSEPELKKFKDNIDGLRKRYHIAFCMIHHPRKTYTGNDDMGIEEMLTSSIFGNWLDTAIRVAPLHPDDDQPTEISMRFQKVKDAEDKVPEVRLKFNKKTVRFHLF